MAEPSGHWSDLSRRWSAVGSPQRPCSEDLQLLFELAVPAAVHQALRVGVLGVTPELVQGSWPAGSQLQAFERAAEVIQHLWAPHPRHPSLVHQAEWHALPIADHSLDLVIGDGCTTQFPDRDYYQAFFTEMQRVLRPGGALVMRCFLRPTVPEPLEAVAASAQAGQLQQFGTLKWLIAMALTDSGTLQVPVDAITEAFDRLFPDREALANSSGWTADCIDSIEAYRGSDNVYTFPTLEQLGELCGPAMTIHVISHGRYELAECCPILRLTPGAER